VRIFISYSVQDTSLIRQFADGLKSENGVSQVHWWEDSKRLGQEAWPQIFSWIDEADLVLVIVTGNVLSRAMAGGNEVGRAKAKGKYIIPLVSKVTGWRWLLQKLGFKVGISTADLGCLGDLVHVRISEHDPKAGIEKIKLELTQLVSARQLQLVSAQQDAEQALLIIGVLTAVGLLWAASK
jgi:hypothetical protein